LANINALRLFCSAVTYQTPKQTPKEKQAPVGVIIEAGIYHIEENAENTEPGS